MRVYSLLIRTSIVDLFSNVAFWESVSRALFDVYLYKTDFSQSGFVLLLFQKKKGEGRPGDKDTEKDTGLYLDNCTFDIYAEWRLNEYRV